MLKENYFPQKSLMDATNMAKPSWASSKIPEGTDFLKEKLLWQVMDGEDINLWQIMKIKRLAIPDQASSQLL